MPVALAVLPFLVASPADWTVQAVEIRTRDGARLAADLHLPAAEGKFPAILVQTPYGIRRFLREAVVDDPEGYAFVVVDWRGFFDSRGAGRMAATGRKRGEDGYDCVEWVAAQAWCTGKVGTWGPSALGNVQYLTAREAPPHLGCTVPVVAVPAYEYRTFYPGGVFRKEYAEVLDRLGFGERGFGSRLLGGRPTRDGFWRLAETQDRPEAIATPTLVVAGWYDIHADEGIDSWRDLRARGAEPARGSHRLIVGPWTHHAVHRERQGDLSFPGADLRTEVGRWFDRWLRDGTKAAPGPPVLYYRTGENGWRAADAWPPVATSEIAWRLRPDRSLGAGPSSGEAFVEFPSRLDDPVPTVGGSNLNPVHRTGPCDQAPRVESRADVVSFTSPALEKDLRLAGAPSLRAFVSVDASDGEIVVRLTDVHPDGRSILVGDAAARLALPPPHSTIESLEPGKVVERALVLANCAHTFAKGHRVRISVSGSSYPRYALVGSTDGAESAPTALHYRLRLDDDHPSALVLPVLADGANEKPWTPASAPATPPPPSPVGPDDDAERPR